MIEAELYTEGFCGIKNTVYLSYLDSAQLYEGSKDQRRIFYHLILKSFIIYHKSSGYKYIVIWSVDSPGDYILRVKPVEQLVPNNDILKILYENHCKQLQEDKYIKSIQIFMYAKHRKVNIKTKS